VSWRQRLAALLAAGGALAACDSPSHQVNFCGNVDPDPCICDRLPLDAGQCVAERACADAGGTWSFYTQYNPVTGLDGMCIYPDARLPDAAVDAAPSD
jgi:hypothetical protein